MADYYVLDGKEPRPVDMMTWAQSFEGDRVRVGKDTVGDATVSTVFLGLDHNWGDGPPLLFETMVFGGSLDETCERYSTWDEAEAGHARMIERVKAAP